MTEVLSKNTDISITEAEWELMRVLWSQEEITSRVLIDIVLANSTWKVGTIKSLLSRLVDKGCVEKDTSHSPFLYRPLLDEQTALLFEMNKLLDSTCQREIGFYMAQIFNNRALSIQDIDGLIEILTAKRRTAPRELSCNCQPGTCSLRPSPYRVSAR